MTQLTADEQTILQAFQAAVATYKQQGRDLPEEIAAIGDQLEPNIEWLDALSEGDPTFEMVYKSTKSALQIQSSQRAKFIDTAALPSSQPPPPNVQVDPVESTDNAINHSNYDHPAMIEPPSNRSRPSIVDNFDRIAIMGAGGAFLGGAIVQFFGGGASQFIGAAVGALVGIGSGWYVTPKPTQSDRNL
jgi:hypothetical protein